MDDPLQTDPTPDWHWLEVAAERLCDYGCAFVVGLGMACVQCAQWVGSYFADPPDTLPPPKFPPGNSKDGLQ